MKYLVLFFQLVLARGFHSPPDLLRVDEEFCSRVSATQIVQWSENVALKNVSVSPVGDTPKKDLLKWTLFQHHPTTGTCISETVLKWHQYCAHYQDIDISMTLHQTQKCVQAESARGCGDSTPSLSVDYLFLVERPCKRSNSSIETLLSTLRALAKYTSDRNIFHDVHTQFGFVVYDSQGNKPEVVYAKDFSSLLPSDLYPHLFGQCGREGDETTSSGRHVKSVDGAVRMIRRALRLVSSEAKFHWSVKFGTKQSCTLWHRPYSDLHIVSVIDLKAELGKTGSIEELETNTRDRAMKLPEKIFSTASYPVSFHVFFSASNSFAKSLLGPQKHSVRYADYSHFRKAPTLMALIDADHKDCLQAHLLSKGVELQVHSLQDLRNPRCLVGISPALSSPLGLIPAFPNLCEVGGESEGEFCSSNHGWTKKDDRTSNSYSFQDRVPLSGNFSSSHADIAKSASQSSRVEARTMSAQELSVSKVVEGCCNVSPPQPRIVGHPRVAKWKQHKPFIQAMIEGGEPVVLRGTVVETWGALKKWNMSYLAKNMDTDILNLVKSTNHFLTFDPDHRAALKLNISLPYSLSNMSTSDFFQCIQSRRACSDGYRGHYYFGTVPSSLKSDVLPDSLLYNTEKDKKASKQFMWISSAGMITHTHFDQDYNIFVQLVGRKRFTLWSHDQHDLMYMYPRVHPMWHKSRVNFGSVDRDRFPAFARARAVQAELGPGDMLYVPPYTWHYVETLSPSVSLSTWSHDYQLYDHMKAIYRHDHKFDLLESQQGQMFALRLYLDMMVHDLYGFNETTQFFARLLHNRFTGLEHLFPPSEDDPAICAASVSGKIPTCVHVHGYAKLDMSIVGQHFQSLEPVVRDILFGDYVEEITAQVVGVRKMLAFFRYCFLGQEYYITDVDEDEHSLWDHKDIET